MTNPPIIHDTHRLVRQIGKPRPTRRDKKVKALSDRRSQIVKLSVQYVQLLGAYDAGFAADLTGGSEFAGSGRQISRARKKLLKLIALSPHLKPESEPLCAEELGAKASVLKAMYGLRNDEELDEMERAFVRFFAGEVADFIADQQERAKHGSASLHSCASIRAVQ